MPVIGCPTCSAKLKLPELNSAMTFKCPKCGSLILGAPEVPAFDAFQESAPVEPAPPTNLMPYGSTVPCPYCGEQILPEARKCKHCGERLDSNREERPRRSRRGRSDADDGVGFECPFCGSRVPPIIRSQISAGGWVMFAVMLLLCWPLFWIGLLMKEDYRVCADCGVKLG